MGYEITAKSRDTYSKIEDYLDALPTSISSKILHAINKHDFFTHIMLNVSWENGILTYTIPSNPSRMTISCDGEVEVTYSDSSFLFKFKMNLNGQNRYAIKYVELPVKENKD